MAARGAEAEALFETHTAAELREAERRLRAGIEQKREELRQMVGERYRDLIEAADTIAEMRLSAERLLGSVRGLQRGGVTRPGPAPPVSSERLGGGETRSGPSLNAVSSTAGSAAGAGEAVPGGGTAEAAAGHPRAGVERHGGRAIPARRPPLPAVPPPARPAAARRAPRPLQPRPRPLPHPAAPGGRRQPLQVGSGMGERDALRAALRGGVVALGG